jgi:hypothetical protein
MPHGVYTSAERSSENGKLVEAAAPAPTGGSLSAGASTTPAPPFGSPPRIGGTVEQR